MRGKITLITGKRREAHLSRSWEFLLTRLGHHRREDRVRTYGAYQIVVDGIALPKLSGFVAEAPGPGDNAATGKNRLRIEAGKYGLVAHRSDRYRTRGYEKDLTLGPVHPMPAVKIIGDAMGERTDVLIHPAHPAEPHHSGIEAKSDLFLSSIGCLNLTGPVTRDEDMDWTDSRARVVSVLQSLATWVGGTPDYDQPYPGARITILGEPTAEI